RADADNPLRRCSARQGKQLGRACPTCRAGGRGSGGSATSTSEAVMVTKKRSGSERAQPGSRAYLAIERTRQGAFSSHPKGMALPVLRFVEALDRAFRPA